MQIQTDTYPKSIFVRSRHSFINVLVWLIFIVITIWGFWASIDVGIGWDEEAERSTLNFNLTAIERLLQGSQHGYETLLAHTDRYYGIGFHLPAYFLAQFLQSTIKFFSGVTLSTNPLILAHLSVWICFLGSAVLVRILLKHLIANDFIANLGMLVFTLWPYLLGHGLMNIKDTPFMFAWLLCTVIALPLTQIPNLQESQRLKPAIGKVILLALATAWLLSIRIAGILIFAQYCCMLLSYWYFSCTKFSGRPHSYISILRFIAYQLAIFIPIFTTVLIMLYPVSWHNPLELINAISYMSHHPWEGTTLTAGRFIRPGSKLHLYFTVWLLAKLPMLVVIGLLLSPWAQSRQIRQSLLAKKQFQTIALWMGLAGGVLIIVLTLIIMRVSLYNELRQTLFLFPLLFVLGISSLYFLSQRITQVSLWLTGTFFIVDNFSLYPYNYSYINEVARQRPAIQYFETDYFGFSAGRSARWLSTQPQYENAHCIYAYPIHLLSYELNHKMYPCIQTSNGHARNLTPQKTSLLYITQRNLINFAIPTQCILIFSEERTLPLSRQPLIMGRLFECNPVELNQH